MTVVRLPTSRFVAKPVPSPGDSLVMRNAREQQAVQPHTHRGARLLSFLLIGLGTPDEAAHAKRAAAPAA